MNDKNVSAPPDGLGEGSPGEVAPDSQGYEPPQLTLTERLRAFAGRPDGTEYGGYALLREAADRLSERDQRVNERPADGVNSYRRTEPGIPKPVTAVSIYRATVRQHYLGGIECLHEHKQDVSRCGWGDWQSQKMPSVGAAVEAWMAHVDEMFDDAAEQLITVGEAR